MGDPKLHVRGDERQVRIGVCEHDTGFDLRSGDWRRGGESLLDLGQEGRFGSRGGPTAALTLWPPTSRVRSSVHGKKCSAAESHGPRLGLKFHPARGVASDPPKSVPISRSRCGSNQADNFRDTASIQGNRAASGLPQAATTGPISAALSSHWSFSVPRLARSGHRPIGSFRIGTAFGLRRGW